MADEYTRELAGSYYTVALQRFLIDTYVRPTPAQALALARGRAADMPQIQISELDGQLLRVLLRMARATRVVEIGTLAGYSGVWILEALPEDGHLYTIEADPRHAEVARGTFREAGLAHRVTVKEGLGNDVLPTLTGEGPFDAVFIDADKGSMPAYLSWARANLRPGGLVLVDNAFLFGCLTDREPDDEGYRPVIEAVRRFHQELAETFDAVPIPTPQGLSVGIQRG